MSQGIGEEMAMWANRVHTATENKDIEGMFKLSQVIVEFDEEWGDAIRQLARRFEREEWQHDELKNN